MSGPPDNIVATAAMTNAKGDTFEIGAFIHWHSDAPTRAAIGGLMGPYDNIGLAVGYWDPFDFDGASEPLTRLRACVHNDCPADAPACPSVVCAEIHAAGTVNLEGAWFVDGGGFCGDTVILTQDGRVVADADESIERGHVRDKFFSFDRYDAHYEGVLAWDRDHIEGLAWETMTLTSMGTWSATRIASPLPLGSSRSSAQTSLRRLFFRRHPVIDRTRPCSSLPPRTHCRSRATKARNGKHSMAHIPKNADLDAESGNERRNPR
jgi:hypothetical protein